jgi:hypothetical protein
MRLGLDVARRTTRSRHHHQHGRGSLVPASPAPNGMYLVVWLNEVIDGEGTKEPLRRRLRVIRGCGGAGREC